MSTLYGREGGGGGGAQLRAIAVMVAVPLRQLMVAVPLRQVSNRRLWLRFL